MATLRRDPVLVTDKEASEARSAARSLGKLRRSGGRIKVRPEGGRHEEVVVPAPAFALLLEILDEMAQGHAVTIMPVHGELTTQEAAELLNVSRPFLIGLLDQGKIPFRRVGNRRKVRVADLLAFKRVDDAARDAAAHDLTEEAQRLGLGY
jgi:excisionase family DNA binding protein